MKDLFDNPVKAVNKVERVVFEILRGMPILLHDNSSYILVASSELLEEILLTKYKLFHDNIYLLLSHNRLCYLIENNNLNHEFGRLLLSSDCSVEDIASLIGSNITDHSKSTKNITAPTIILDSYAIKLMKLTYLLPSALIIDLQFKSNEEAEKWGNKNDIILLEKNDLDIYQQNYQLTEICKSSLYLENCQATEIIAYREYNNFLNHYALIIGNPNYEEPVIRIHSSCYTGDLLNSLSCDCRDQLHTAISFMSQNGGGIILYLSQDGRGIGLTNKIRTYQLQIHNNFDTVDANRFLGFEDDERSFIAAVYILRKLNIIKLKLLTNNPKKVNELKKYGLNITDTIPIITKTHEYNKRYVNTKVSRLGHIN